MNKEILGNGKVWKKYIVVEKRKCCTLGSTELEWTQNILSSKLFIHFQFTTLHVNEVAPVVAAVVCMLIKFWVWDGSEMVLGVPHPLLIYNWWPFAHDVIIPNGPQTT